MRNGWNQYATRRYGPTSARRRELAKSRQCPACQRKSALLYYRDALFSGWTCRWCPFTQLRLRVEVTGP